MVGVSTGDGLVVGLGGRVASIARAHRRHAVERLEHGFDAPEAPAAQDDDFLAFGGWIILSVGKGPGIDRQAHTSVSSHTLPPISFSSPPNKPARVDGFVAVLTITVDRA